MTPTYSIVAFDKPDLYKYQGCPSLYNFGTSAICDGTTYALLSNKKGPFNSQTVHLLLRADTPEANKARLSLSKAKETYEAWERHPRKDELEKLLKKVLNGGIKAPSILDGTSLDKFIEEQILRAPQ